MTTKRQPLWKTELANQARRKARLRTCRCGTWILHGLDDDTCAFTVKADLPPLSYPGELAAAYSDGRGTFDLCAGQLWRRQSWQQGRQSEHLVIAEHRCGDPIPAAWLAPTGTSLRFPTEATDEPPF